MLPVATAFLSGCGSSGTSSTAPAAATATTLASCAGASAPMVPASGGKLSNDSLEVTLGSGLVFKNAEDDARSNTTL